MSNHVSSLVRSRNLGVGLTGKSIILLMAEFASDDGTGIWAAKATMARELETSERTIQRTIKALIDAGFVSEVGRKKHRNGETYEYEISLHKVSQCPRSKPEPPTHRHPSTQDIGGSPQDMTPDTPSPPTDCRPTPDTPSPHAPTDCRPNHIEPKGTKCVSGSADPHTQFEKFWEVHPRPKDRDVSKTRFIAAVEAGADVRDILYGAKAYASEQKGNGKQYICGSDAWLADGRWEDFERPPEITPQDRADLIRKMKASKNPAVRAQAEKMEAAE